MRLELIELIELIGYSLEIQITGGKRIPTYQRFNTRIIVKICETINNRLRRKGFPKLKKRSSEDKKERAFNWILNALSGIE